MVSRRLGGRLRLGHGQDVSGVRSIRSSGTLDRGKPTIGPVTLKMDESLNRLIRVYAVRG